jgi:single-strand DNA-binding protein
MYLNKAFVIGNLTRDPELKALPSGSKVCNLAVATNRSYKDKEGSKVDTTEYHNIVAFGKLGELAGQYLKKGQSVFVEGRLQTRAWDGQDGQKRYRTEIIADNIQFGAKPLGGSSYAGSKSDGKTEEQPAPASDEKIEYPQEEINPDDIPF